MICNMRVILHNCQMVQDKTTELAPNSAQVGLIINKRKQKILRVNATWETPILLEGGHWKRLNQISKQYNGHTHKSHGGGHEDKDQQSKSSCPLLRNVWKSSAIPNRDIYLEKKMGMAWQTLRSESSTVT